MQRKAQIELAISIEEAGRRLGLGRTLTYQLVRRGEIPALRLGNRLVVPVAQLEAMLAATSTKGGDETDGSH